MARICVRPENLMRTGEQFELAASSLLATSRRLEKDLGGLDYEVRNRGNLNSRGAEAQRLASRLSESAHQMAENLNRTGAAFQRADEQGQAQLGRISETAVWGVDPRFGFPGSGINGELNLGRLFAPGIPTLLGSGWALGSEWLKTLRKYNLVDPAKDLGRWLNELGDTRGFVGQLGKVGGATFDTLKFLASPLPSTGIGAILDYWAGEDKSLRGGGTAVFKNVIEFGIGKANPYVAAALLASAGVQLGGSLSIGATSGLGQWILQDSYHDEIVADKADDAQQALKKLDLGNITGDLGNITVDLGLLVYDVGIEPRVHAVQDAWNDPSLTNIAKAGLAINPAIPYISTDLQDYQAVWGDVKQTGVDVGNFFVGLVEVPYRMADLQITTSSLVTEEFINKLNGG